MNKLCMKRNKIILELVNKHYKNLTLAQFNLNVKPRVDDFYYACVQNEVDGLVTMIKDLVGALATSENTLVSQVVYGRAQEKLREYAE